MTRPQAVGGIGRLEGHDAKKKQKKKQLVHRTLYFAFTIYELKYSGGFPEPLVGVIPKVWLQHAVYGMHYAVGADEVSRPDAASVDKQASSVEYGARSDIMTK